MGVDPDLKLKGSDKPPNKEQVIKPPDDLDRNLPRSQPQVEVNEPEPSSSRQLPTTSHESFKALSTEPAVETLETEKHKTRKFDIQINKLQLNPMETVKVTKAMLDGLPSSKYSNVSHNYDSDTTEAYWPFEWDKVTTQEVYVDMAEGKEKDPKPKRRNIRAYLS